MGSIPTSAARDMFMTEISLKRRKSLKEFTKKKEKEKWPKGYGFDSH